MSVLQNWQNEFAKFTPDVRFASFPVAPSPHDAPSPNI